MGVVKEVPGAASEKMAADLFQKWGVQIEEIHQTVIRIEDNLDRLMGGHEGLLNEIDGMIDAKITEAFDRWTASIDLPAQIDRLLENLSGIKEAAAVDIDDRLGPGGLR